MSEDALATPRKIILALFGALCNSLVVEALKNLSKFPQISAYTCSHSCVDRACAWRRSRRDGSVQEPDLTPDMGRLILFGKRAAQAEITVRFRKPAHHAVFLKQATSAGVYRQQGLRLTES